MSIASVSTSTYATALFPFEAQTSLTDTDVKTITEQVTSLGDEMRDGM